MADEPTVGELRRNVDDIRRDMRDRHAALGQRLDEMARGTVPLSLYQAHLEASRREHDELGKDIADLAKVVESDQKQRAADRRMVLLALFTSILAPLMLLLVSTYLRGKGASP